MERYVLVMRRTLVKDVQKPKPVCLGMVCGGCVQGVRTRTEESFAQLKEALPD